jgi:hypothetical protein
MRATCLDPSERPPVVVAFGTQLHRVGCDCECGDTVKEVCNPLATPKTCVALCDSTHPCAIGTCVQAPGLEASVCL